MDGERLENVSRECPPLDWCRSRQRTLNPSRTLQKSMLALDEIIRVQLKPGVGFGVPDQFENVVFLANDFGDFRSVDVANAIPPLTLEVQCCVMKDHESGSESDQDTQDKGYEEVDHHSPVGGRDTWLSMVGGGDKIGHRWLFHFLTLWLFGWTEHGEEKPKKLSSCTVAAKEGCFSTHSIPSS